MTMSFVNHQSFTQVGEKPPRKAERS